MNKTFIYWYRLKGEKQNIDDVLVQYIVSNPSGTKPIIPLSIMLATHYKLGVSGVILTTCFYV